MIILLAILAQLLGMALVVATAPWVLPALAWIEARVAGERAAPWSAPWFELNRLRRKQSLVAAEGSGWSLPMPAVVLAALLVATGLVPTIALGTVLAPLSDLLVIGGFSALTRVLLSFAALDGGSPAGGLTVQRATTLAISAEPALFGAFLVLGLAAGTTNVHLIAGLQLSHLLKPEAGVAFAAVTLAILALAQINEGMPETEVFSGPELAMLRIAEGLRLLLWIDLIGALFLPFGISVLDDFPTGWLLGLMCWAARSSALLGLFAVFRVAAGRLPFGAVSKALGVSLLLGVVGAAMVLGWSRPV